MTRNPVTASVSMEIRSVDGGRSAVVVTIDSPPLNLMSVEVRQQFLAAITEIGDIPKLAGVVLTGANGTFISGADIRELGAAPLPPHLTEIVSAIEALPVPVVAAIDGAALGGGYEIALACDDRLCTKRSVVGAPEVTLGLIPGAGGTQKLPRLVGIATAISLITSGRRVPAGEAREIGMIDEIVDGDVIAAALDRIAATGGAKRRVIDRAVPPAAPGEIEAAERQALRKARGAVAVAAAIGAVKVAAALPTEEALAEERRVSLELRRGEQAKALRYLFFAERAATKPQAKVLTTEIGSIGIVGAGRMGQGISVAFAACGYQVQLTDADPAVASAAAAHLQERSGRQALAPEVLARIRPVGLAEMGRSDLVVEAISEDLDAKIGLFRVLDDIVPPHAILVSNTSYLDIDAMAAAVRRPQAVAGLHFFNPADVMRLVEVVQATKTSLETLETLRSTVRRLGKVPVIAGPAPGFIGNRLFSAYRRQCELIVEDGSYPQDVDRVMRDFGMAMGPFEVFDLAGLEIAWAARKRAAATRDPLVRYVGVADRLCEMGRFGRRTGRGWYRYVAGRPQPDDEVTALVDAASAAKGIVRRRIPEEEIRTRLLGAIVNEAAFALEKGTARSTTDIDLVLVHGYGFPRHLGGPLYWAARQPRQAIRDAVARMVQCSGYGASMAPNIEHMLDKAAGLRAASQGAR